MKNLSLDLKNYIENGSVFKRTAVRGLICKNGKYLVIYSRKHGDYKFPGGGMKSGESLNDTLIREVQEETGFRVIAESISTDGIFVHEKRKGDPEDLIDMESYYFYCDIYDEPGETKLDDYEKEEDYQVEWRTLKEVISNNEAISNTFDTEEIPWIVRETMVMKELWSCNNEN